MKATFALILTMLAGAAHAQALRSCDAVRSQAQASLRAATAAYDEGTIDRAAFNEARLSHRAELALHCGETAGFCARARAILQDTADYQTQLADSGMLAAAELNWTQRRIRSYAACE